MKRKRDCSGTTLLEILLSIGTASLLLLTLVLLFTHSQKIFFGEGNASEELRSLGTAMQTLSDKLSTGSVYLVRANHNFLLGEPSSKAETHAPLQRTHATFSSPFQSYSWRIKKQSIPNQPDLTVLTIIVSGPDHTKVTLERIVQEPNL